MCSICSEYVVTAASQVGTFNLFSIWWSPCPLYWQRASTFYTLNQSHPDGWVLAPLKNPQCFPAVSGCGLGTRTRAGGQHVRILTLERDGRRETSRHIPFLFCQVPGTQGNLWSDVFFVQVEIENFAPLFLLSLSLINSNLYHTAAHTHVCVSYLNLNLLSPWSHYSTLFFFLILWH